MACYWLHSNEINVQVPHAEEIGGVTFYKIEVKIVDVKWFVSHRYNEFHDLHNQLVIDHGISKDILPRKKVIRNKSPQFVEDRRKGLEAYLKNILNYLKSAMPRIFVEFLGLHQYDIFFLLRHLAMQFFVESDTILASSKSYKFNPLQLHAISECFKKPFPTGEENDKRYDLTHVLDLCSQLNHLTVQGISTFFVRSNIIPNSLKFEFSNFKSLKTLHMENVDLSNVYSVGNLRDSLEKLVVNRSSATNISEILQCDMIHKTVVESNQVWKSITILDLSNNNITEIDKTISLVPNLKTLILDQNKISSIINLSSLPNLVSLSIANNLLTICDQLHTKLGNILSLNLSQNSISTLKGFAKLYSLETLDVSCNKITDLEEVSCVGDLPCLENLILTGNTVATLVDYRIKVLQNFGERAKEICLDNEKSNQPELDKVSILRALRIVKEGKAPDLSLSFS